MKEIKTATTITKKMTHQEWEQRITECQSSGKSIKAWCSENGISPGAYYFHLRKLRESNLEEKQIISLESPNPEVSSRIHILSGGIEVTLPETVSAEQLTAVLCALKGC